MSSQIACALPPDLILTYAEFKLLQESYLYVAIPVPIFNYINRSTLSSTEKNLFTVFLGQALLNLNKSEALRDPNQGLFSRISANRLSRMCNLTKSTVNKTIASLKAKGWIARETYQSEVRGTQVSKTTLLIPLEVMEGDEFKRADARNKPSNNTPSVEGTPKQPEPTREKTPDDVMGDEFGHVPDDTPVPNKEEPTHRNAEGISERINADQEYAEFREQLITQKPDPVSVGVGQGDEYAIRERCLLQHLATLTYVKHIEDEYDISEYIETYGIAAEPYHYNNLKEASDGIARTLSLRAPLAEIQASDIHRTLKQIVMDIQTPLSTAVGYLNEAAHYKVFRAGEKPLSKLYTMISTRCRAGTWTMGLMNELPKDIHANVKALNSLILKANPDPVEQEIYRRLIILSASWIFTDPTDTYGIGLAGFVSEHLDALNVLTTEEAKTSTYSPLYDPEIDEFDGVSE